MITNEHYNKVQLEGCYNSYMKVVLIALVLCLAAAQYNESMGKLLGQLTVASYCRPSLISAWTCDPCKRYPGMKFVTVMRNSTNDTLGFIGVSDALDATSKVGIQT